MNGEIDASVDERLLDFLGEERFAADLGERPVGDAVAAGAHRHDRDGARRRQGGMRRRKPRHRLLRLRQGERAAARAEPEDRGHGLPLSRGVAAPTLPVTGEGFGAFPPP